MMTDEKSLLLMAAKACGYELQAMCDPELRGVPEAVPLGVIPCAITADERAELEELRENKRKLDNPAAIHAMMLRGVIPVPTWRQHVHLSGPVPNTEDEQLAEIVRLRELLAEITKTAVPAVPDHFRDATKMVNMEEWREVMKDLADDAEQGLLIEYADKEHYPSLMRKFNRDMDIVNRARALLGANHD